MTDREFEKLQERVVNGKAWVERIKADGTYSAAANHQYLLLWFRLGNVFLQELVQRNAKPTDAKQQGLVWFGRDWHSKAWVVMRHREMEADDKREKARIRRAELADEKRRGFR